MGSEQQIVATDGEPHRHLLTVQDFVTLDEAGAFDGMGRVELIDGEIFVMAPLYFPHGQTQLELGTAVGLAVRAIDGLVAVAPVSAELDPNSLPEADILIVQGTSDRFVTREMVRIMIEVSASSLRHDLGPKLKLYARAGVPEYWVADITGRRIIRFHAPAGENYAERKEYPFGDPVSSATIPGLVVDTSRLA